MSKKIVMYGHPGCPMVPPMRSMLKQSEVDFDYINIFKDHAARARVKEINQGYESVPTFVFPDSTTLTEPSTRQLKHKLEAMGYRVPIRAQLTGNAINLLFAVLILWAVLSFLGVA